MVLVFACTSAFRSPGDVARLRVSFASAMIFFTSSASDESASSLSLISPRSAAA